METDRTDRTDRTGGAPAAGPDLEPSRECHPTARKPRRSWVYLLATLMAAAVLSTACQTAARSQGATQTTNPVWNPAYIGECTWGAEEMWYQATGSYLTVSGAAWQWAGSAAANGWTVTSTPSTRAIVVFQPGMAGAHGDGHVAWVTAVTQRADGTYLDVTEMNWTYGRYNWDNRTLKTDPGMSYILAP